MIYLGLEYRRQTINHPTNTMGGGGPGEGVLLPEAGELVEAELGQADRALSGTALRHLTAQYIPTRSNITNTQKWVLFWEFSH